jgi:hypothetical protein
MHAACVLLLLSRMCPVSPCYVAVDVYPCQCSVFQFRGSVFSKKEVCFKLLFVMVHVEVHFVLAENFYSHRHSVGHFRLFRKKKKIIGEIVDQARTVTAHVRAYSYDR